MTDRFTDAEIRAALTVIAEADVSTVPDLEDAADVLLALHPNRPCAKLAGALAADALAQRDQVRVLTLAMRKMAAAIHRTHVGPRAGSWQNCPHDWCSLAHDATEGRLRPGPTNNWGRVMTFERSEKEA